MPITHSFISEKEDGADETLVRPSDWNAEHVGVADYAAIAYACDSGSTLPESPVGGQWFLHTKTNRNILYQYEISPCPIWRPMAAFGDTLEIYVDNALGSYDMEYGDGPGVDAIAINDSDILALILNPSMQFSGIITIYLADGSYSRITLGTFQHPSQITFSGASKAGCILTNGVSLQNNISPVVFQDLTIPNTFQVTDCKDMQFANCILGDDSVEVDEYTISFINSKGLFNNTCTIKRFNGTHTIVLVDNSYVILCPSTIDGIDKTVDGVDVINNGRFNIVGGTIQNCDTGVVARTGGVLTKDDETYTNNNLDEDLDPHEEYAFRSHASEHENGGDDEIDLEDLSGIPADVATVNIAFVIDGGGAEITAGVKGFLEIPFDCTLIAWTLTADVAGAIVIDVWKDSYANFPPTNADAMPGTGKEPTIAATNQKAQDTDISDWASTAITAGDILAFNVDSCTDITKVTLNLKATRT